MTESVPTRQAKPFVSLKWKLLIGFAFIFTVVFAATFIWFYEFSSHRALSRVHQDLLHTLNGAVAGIEVDAVERLIDAMAADGDSSQSVMAHRSLLNWLYVVRDIEPRAWPYIYIPGERSGELIFLVDLFVRDDGQRSDGFGDVYVPTTEAPQIGLTEQVTQLAPYTDRWGHWVSGYSPLIGAGNEPIAAVGVDFEADHIKEVQADLRNRMLVAFAIGSLLLVFLVFVLAQAFTRPIARLTAAARSVEEGTYRAALGLARTGPTDEIGVLSDAFAAMAAKVLEREQTLRRKVESLRIEIDDAKRQEEVNEIVDTDFFRELQRKAVVLRKRRDSLT